MIYTGERVMPWNAACGIDVIYPHIMRYAWASRFCWQKDVVDLGCGTGYGSFILSLISRNVTGADIDEDALEYAVTRFQASNLSFTTCDLDVPEFPIGDIYVAFEVLEHLDDPLAVARLARPMVWSMPISHANPWHKQVLSIDEMEGYIGEVSWLQGLDGQIVERSKAGPDPVYALGVIE